MFASQAVQAAATGTLDPSQIMASVGEVPYAWTIESDALSWGANAASVLMVRNATAIANGRAYAKLLDPATTLTRIDAVMKSPHRDEGAGIPYQIQYPLITTGTDKKLWVEDTGRWFADGNGKPMRAQGIVRVINERHEQEEKLEFLSRFDGLTGEMNRFHLTEVLEAARDDVVRTSVGPVAVTVTTGGVSAPRRARTVAEILARAQEPWSQPRPSARVRSRPIVRTSSAMRCGGTTCAPPTRSSQR